MPDQTLVIYYIAYMEKFKQIKDYQGYKISNYGRVWSNKTKRFLKVHENTNGYLRVVLNGKQIFIHRLVAEHFCDGRRDGLIVHHRDGNRLNNHFSNLEWTTQSHNLKLAKRKYQPEKNGHAKLNWETVKQIRVEYATSKISQRKLAAKYGIKKSAMNCILNYQTWVI